MKKAVREELIKKGCNVGPRAPIIFQKVVKSKKSYNRKNSKKVIED